MVDHYEKQRRIAVKLKNWIIDENRGPWHEFTRGIRQSFGYPPKTCLKILHEDYPSLTIENNQLVKL